MSNYNSGFYSGEFGHNLDIGRFIKTKEEGYNYAPDGSTNKKGLCSYSFGNYSTILGHNNFTAGGRHFIRANHSTAFGEGSAINSGDGNSINSSCDLVFGKRCRIENSSESLSGGYYS